MEPRLIHASLLAAIAAAPAFAGTYYLQSDLGVRGIYHFCQYNNGKVYSYNATELCPLSISDDVNNSASYTAPGKVGFKVGEYQDGMTKVCVYNVMGQKAAIRIGSVELCPLNYNF